LYVDLVERRVTRVAQVATIDRPIALALDRPNANTGGCQRAKQELSKSHEGSSGEIRK
jgi:hypothetical protein